MKYIVQVDGGFLKESPIDGLIGTYLQEYATMFPNAKVATEAGLKFTRPPVAGGVVCKCPANFCPMHGKNMHAFFRLLEVTE